MKAPFPYFGKKSTIAPIVWQALGQPKHYIEPFFGSGAVLLNRPNWKSNMVETVNDKDGFLCLAPKSRVLTSDLKWVAIGDCLVGDKLLAFDEFNTGPKFKLGAPSGYRHWRIATVLKTETVMLPSYRLVFSDGTEIICSENHKWLVGKNRGLRWLSTKNWNTTIGRRIQKAWVLKILPVIEKEDTYESGWLGGFADGEGHYHGSAHKGGGSWAVSLHQSRGTIIDYAEKLLQNRKYSLRREHRHKPPYKEMVFLHINGGMAETFRFLMSHRPERLIENLVKGIERKSIYTRKKQYVSVERMEYIGVQEVVALKTDTHTYIAEGLASHNCNVWRSLQFAPDEVARWCDWPINHADLAARKKELIKNETHLLENLITSPEWYDAKLAGYWIWAASCWIGSGLTKIGQIPHISDGGKGVHALGQMPHISNAGMGVQDPYKITIYAWFRKLSERLRGVRVVCGDWTRVCGGNWQDKMGSVGIFFDPPYGDVGRNNNIYHHDDISIAADVMAWCLKRGDKKTYRIILAGYDEHQELLQHGWTSYAWKTVGGYGNQGKGIYSKENRHRETLYFSPNCLAVKKQEGLF